MSYPLRLPPNLDAAARERCQRLGISLNALIAVALDEYLSRSSKSPPAAVVAAPKVDRRRVGSKAPIAYEGHPDWRFFDPDPDLWPIVDPDPDWRAQAAKFEDTPEGLASMEEAYWATRQRPSYP